MALASALLSKVGHSPTLATILMVEDALAKSGETVSLADLKRKLPRKVMHSTLLQVLDYLQASGKVFIGTKGLTWVFAPRPEIEALKRRGLKL